MCKLWGQNKTTQRICMNNDLPKLPFQLRALKGLKSYGLCAACITDAEKPMGYTT